METLQQPAAFERSIANYRKVGIEIEVLENKDGIPIVLVKQTKLYNGYILNQKQLVERAKKLFAPQKIHVKPSAFSLDVQSITIEWIEAQMETYGIKRKDLIKQLAIDKSSLSLIFSGKTELSQRTKATFFYYFLTYQLNSQFRT